MTNLNDLMAVFPHPGVVEWIGLRPAKLIEMETVDRVTASTERGLHGDRYGKAGGRRQVTLIQAEHLAVVAGLLGIPRVTPDLVRRNLVVRGLNLLALKHGRFRVGEALLECTGLCHPCSRMESALGTGGYNAMRGHGGITARVVEDGEIRLGCTVVAVPGAGR
jgi:MOSC domain-containing protein YiiM